MVCSRYRRGKPQSGDIDIVFCPPEKDQDIGLLKDLYLRLSALGIITHVLRESIVPFNRKRDSFRRAEVSSGTCQSCRSIRVCPA